MKHVLALLIPPHKKHNKESSMCHYCPKVSVTGSIIAQPPNLRQNKTTYSPLSFQWTTWCPEKLGRLLSSVWKRGITVTWSLGFPQIILKGRRTFREQIVLCPERVSDHSTRGHGKCFCFKGVIYRSKLTQQPAVFTCIQFTDWIFFLIMWGDGTSGHSLDQNMSYSPH